MSEAGTRELDAETPDADDGGDGEERDLSTSEKRTVALLGVPTLALAVTVVTTYLPSVAHAFVSSNIVRRWGRRDHGAALRSADAAMPDEEHGALTGYYSLSRGLGTWFGPLLAGAAISSLGGVFSATHGYQAVWGVCAVAVLVRLRPVRWLRRNVDD